MENTAVSPWIPNDNLGVEKFQAYERLTSTPTRAMKPVATVQWSPIGWLLIVGEIRLDGHATAEMAQRRADGILKAAGFQVCLTGGENSGKNSD